MWQTALKHPLYVSPSLYIEMCVYKTNWSSFRFKDKRGIELTDESLYVLFL